MGGEPSCSLFLIDGGGEGGPSGYNIPKINYKVSLKDMDNKGKHIFEQCRPCFANRRSPSVWEGEALSHTKLGDPRIGFTIRQGEVAALV